MTYELNVDAELRGDPVATARGSDTTLMDAPGSAALILDCTQDEALVRIAGIVGSLVQARMTASRKAA